MDIQVTIQCITYNHKDYLRQALDSFLAQKTSFGYEIIVHDDCSTDGTTEILREYASRYPDLIIPIYEDENQWKKTGMKPVFRRMTQMSRGKYIAYCEGDDFWQDPHKLQKQVDVMEQHPDASMCYTGFQVVNNSGKPFFHEGYERWNKEGHSGDIFFDLLQNNFILTPTTLYRKDVFLTPIYLNTPLRLDYFAFLSAAAIGTAVYLPERTACYRQTPGGAMATQLPWVKERFFSIKEYFLMAYATGQIRKPWSLSALKTKIEAWNLAIRKKMAGDDMYFVELYKTSNFPPLYNAIALMQVKWQNWNYNHK